MEFVIQKAVKPEFSYEGDLHMELSTQSILETLTPKKTRTRHARDIGAELDHIGFPDEIKRKARELYPYFPQNCRKGKKLNQLLFYITYSAYLELGYKPEPFLLARKFNLDDSKAQKSLSVYASTQYTYRPPAVFTTPMDIIPEYVETLGLAPELADAIVALAADVTQKHPELLQKNLRKVTGALMYYYFSIHGIVLHDELALSKLVKKAPNTITNFAKEISAIHNS